jgi:hypothetical protein
MGIAGARSRGSRLRILAFAILVLFAVKFSLQPSAFSLWLKSMPIRVIRG